MLPWPSPCEAPPALSLHPPCSQVAYNWVLDRTHYPTWDDIVDAAAAVKVRVTVYVTPPLP